MDAGHRELRPEWPTAGLLLDGGVHASFTSFTWMGKSAAPLRVFSSVQTSVHGVHRAVHLTAAQNEKARIDRGEPNSVRCREKLMTGAHCTSHLPRSLRL